MNKKYRHKYYIKNKKKINERDRKNYYNPANYKHLILKEARKRAKRKGLEFDIKTENIIIPTRCPILGISLKRNKKHKSACSPSLDRIDNRKGYTKGNIQVISDKANTMKYTASPRELVMFAHWVLNNPKLNPKNVTTRKW